MLRIIGTEVIEKDEWSHFRHNMEGLQGLLDRACKKIRNAEKSRSKCSSPDRNISESNYINGTDRDPKF
jgi:hypothetical protein